MSLHANLTVRLDALVKATLKKKGETRQFLQLFTKELIERLAWPEQDVRTEFSFAEPDATVTCTLWLSLHADHLPVTVHIPLTITAQPLNDQHGGFDLCVDDVGTYPVVAREHSQAAEAWPFVLADLVERLTPRFEQVVAEVFNRALEELNEMVRIKLIRMSDAGVNTDDVRDPYILTVSRVPCIGEIIYSKGTTPGRNGERGPGTYKILNVIHETGVSSGDIVATVNAEYTEA